MLNKLARCVAKAVPCWLFGMVGFTSSVLTAPAVAQITPAANATGTTVEVVNQQFNIGGGRLSGDGQNLFHLFQHFNIHQGQTANFLSSPQIRNILAGVNGGYASYVNGVLQVTGGNSNLYLLNPAGIVFGPNAQLNLPAAFHASTAQRVHFGNGIFDLNGLNSYSQLNSSPLGFEFANKGIVINEGNLRVNSGQSLTLMAHQVINTGTLGAAGGTVNVVVVPDAGLVRVSQEGMLLSLEIPQERLPATGIIQPVDLPTLLTGGNGYPAVNSVIQYPDGTIRLVHDSTKIPLTTNTAVIGGTLDVSHTTGAGGKITVAGQGSNVALLNAQLTAAGNTGGGTILVGGDYLGGTTGTNRLDRTFNAGNLFINAGTTLNANALNQGNGGTVINWADNSTRFYGQVSARGGTVYGNGGFVEVSGKQYLDFQGRVDTTAPNGTTGTFLLDPTDIYIVSGTIDFNITPSSPFEAASSFSPSSELSIATLLSALNSSNVIVTTASAANGTGNIYVETPISSSSTNSLTLQADNNIIIGHPISLQGSLILQAQGLIQNRASYNNSINISATNISVNAPIQTNGTNITLQASGNILLPSTGNVLRTSGGSINLQTSGGSISLGGSVGASSGSIQFTGNTNLLNSTDFSGRNITFNGNITGNYPLRIDSTGDTRVTGTISTANLVIRASGSIQLNNVTTSSGIYLDSSANRTANIIANNLETTQNNSSIRVFAGKDVVLGNVVSAGEPIGIFALASLSTGDISNRGGFVYLGANLDANVGDVTTGGGNLEIAAGRLTIRDVDTSGSGGNVSLIAGNITAGNVFTNGGRFSAQTGSLSLKLGGRSIEPTDVDLILLRGTRTLVELVNDNFTINPSGNLTLGNLLTNGGNVNLSSGQITLNWINAGTGSIQLDAQNGFRATGTFDSNGLPTSLLGQQIRININNSQPFLVGNSAENGTAGAIQVTDFTLTPLQTLSGVFERGRFRFENTGLNLSSISQQEANRTLQPVSPTDTPLQGLTGESLQGETLGSPVISISDIAASLAKSNFEQALSLLEQKSCADIAAYLGSACGAKELSLKDSQAILNEISKQTGKKPAIIYTLARPNQLDLLVVTPEGQPIYASSPVGREQLLRTVETFTNSIRDPRLINTRAYLATAQQLYQWMIAPLRAELDAQGIDTLTFVLDAGMRAIPIAALHDGSGFLVERFSLGLMPSLSLVDTRYRPLQGQRVLAMGGSEFVDLSPLPAVPVELEQVTQALGGGSKFLNEDFTLSNLQQEHRRGVYPVIHLATHGEFQPGAPQNSYLAFQDRRLTLPELRQLRLYRPQTELLTLSACRTAVGDLDAELGFAGLSVQSGAKSVLASLWYASDEGTLALMTEFYNQLTKVPIKAEALRQAQLAMLRGEVAVKGNELRTIRGGIPLPPEVVKEGGDRSLSHPYFWAAFTMIGSPW